MKKYIILGVTAVIMAASCTKEQVPAAEEMDVKEVKKTFSANIQGETKTSLNSGKYVYWTEGDRISIFDNVNNKNNAFTTVSESVDGVCADFEGYTVDAATEYVAVYPYKYGSSYNSSTKTVTTTFPVMQKAVLNGFDTDVNVMVAKSSDGNLSFKNVCALLKIKVDVDNVRTVALANESGRMSGQMDIALNDDGTFTVTGKSQDVNSSREVFLDNGGLPMARGDYYFVVMPGTYKYIYISVTTTSDEQYVLKFAKGPKNEAIQIKSNTITPLPDVSEVKGAMEFKLTNIPDAPISLVDDWTIGYEITNPEYVGYKLECKNKQNNIISEVPATITTDANTLTGDLPVKFNKRPGTAIMDVVYDGVYYPVVFDVRPWYRDEPSDWVLATTDATMSDVMTSAEGEEYVEITSNASGHGNIKRSGKPWFSPAMAPIACLRITDPADQGISSSIKFDCSNFKFNNVSFAGEIGNGNRKFVHKYSLSDGSVVLVYDLSAQTMKAAEIPSDFLADGNVQFKICDFKQNGAAAQATYKFFWFRSFGSLADLEAYLSDWSEETGLTYEKVK